MFDPANPLGVHEDISDEMYSEAAGLRRSELKVLAGGQPADVIHYREFGIPDSPDLLFGRALDVAVLTPHLFEERFAIAPVVNKRTNAGKATLEAFMKDAGKRDVIEAPMAEMLDVCAAAVRNSTVAMGLLEGTTRQLSAWWNASTMSGGEILCKTRPDAVLPELGRTVDLKTTKDFSDHSFARSVVDYGYDLQAYMNFDGFRSCGLDWKEHVQIAVRKPTNRQRVDVRCFTWTMDSPWIQRGEQVFDSLLHRYEKMIENEETHGWSSLSTALPMPKWIAADTADIEAVNEQIRKGLL